jgi:tRNA(Ile)-lysidine synthase TilS/MesJ
MNYHSSFTFDPNPTWAWEFKDMLLKRLSQIPDEYALSFSGGVDSSMLLYGLMELNKPPKQLLTFQVEDYETNDLYYSRKIADGYGIPITIVKIPKISKAESSEILYDVINRAGISRKIDVQVCYAYHYMLKEIQTNYLVAGLYEDVIYEANAKLRIKYKDVLLGNTSKQEFDEYYNKRRQNFYEDKNENGHIHNYLVIRNYLSTYGISLDTPLQTKEIFEHFQNVNYEQCNFKIEDGEMIEKKKWFVTDLIFKDQFDRFGNSKNKSNFHTKKEKGDINTLHCEIFDCNKKNIIGEFNKIKKTVQHSWFKPQ